MSIPIPLIIVKSRAHLAASIVVMHALRQSLHLFVRSLPIHPTLLITADEEGRRRPTGY
jgi:hypothetical protein